jgi:rhomboid family GlyGly-CTERM serine protease
MEFDRFLILRGEIWRLLTGHLVHWSPAHFYLDSIVFILQGITFEKKIGRSYWLMLLLSALFIGASLLIFRHNLSYYRGISGLINTQLVVGTGFFIMDKTLEKRIRGLYVICFSIHMIKIIYETIKRVPFFPTHLIGDMGLFTPGAHLSGIFLGFIFLIIYLMSISGDSRGNLIHRA